MAKKRRRRKSVGGSCKRVRVCGKLRTICRDRKGRIKSNTAAGTRRRKARKTRRRR